MKIYNYVNMYRKHKGLSSFVLFWGLLLWWNKARKVCDIDIYNLLQYGFVMEQYKDDSIEIIFIKEENI